MKFRHVKRKISNLLKMIQMPSFYQENFIEYCVNKKIRDVSESENF